MENHFPQATSLFCDKIDRSNTEEQQEILNVLTENIDIEPDAEVYDDDNIRDFPVKTKKDDDLTEKNNKVVRIDLKVKRKPATKRKSEQKFEELATSVVGSGFKKSKPGFHEILFYEKLQKYMEGEVAIPPKLEPKPWLNEDGTVKKTRIQKWAKIRENYVQFREKYFQKYLRICHIYGIRNHWPQKNSKNLVNFETFHYFLSPIINPLLVLLKSDF